MSADSTSGARRVTGEDDAGAGTDAPESAAEHLPDHESAGGEAPSGETSGGAGLWGVSSISLVAIAALFVVVFGLKQTAGIIMPAFLAITLAIAAQPLQGFLVRKGLPRWAACTLTLLVLYLILGAFVGMLVWSVWIAAEEVPAYTDKFNELYHQALDQLANLGVEQTQIQQSLKGIDPNTIMSTLQSVTSGVSSAGTQLSILVIALTFMAFDVPGIARRSDVIRTRRPHLADAIEEFNHGVRQYWIVSTIFGLIVAVIDVVALWALGVPLALVWGVLAFVTNYIPNVGFILGLIPPALFALLTGGPMTMLWVIVAYSVINFVMQSLIQPKFTGDAVGLTPTVTFLSLVFWSSVAGALGAILAVPLTLAVKAIFIDPDQRMAWLSTFLTTSSADGKKQKRRENKTLKTASAVKASGSTAS